MQAEASGRRPERICLNFAKIALPHTVPVLTLLLTKQEEEIDDDEWTISMAAGTCLSLVANTVQDEIVRYVLPFVEQNIRNPNWKFKEAAVMALGLSSLLSAPSSFWLNPSFLSPK